MRKTPSPRPAVEQLEDRSVPATYFVAAPDLAAPDGSGTVTPRADGNFDAANPRAAVAAANLTADDDIIVLQAGTYTLDYGGADDTDGVGATGDLDVRGGYGTLAVTGAGSAQTVVRANFGGYGDRVLDVQSGADLTLTGLTLTGGRAPGGPFFQAGGGGGLRMFNSAVALQDVEVTGNVSDNQLGGPAVGGGISLVSGPLGGTLTLTGSRVTDNTTSGYGAIGGGIFAYGGTLNLIDTTVARNAARVIDGFGALGGGVYTSLTAFTATASTFADNTADMSASDGVAQGGGLYLDIPLPAATFTDCVVSGNTATGNDLTTAVDGVFFGARAQGGGVYVHGNGNQGEGLQFVRTTVSGNTAQGGTVELTNAGDAVGGDAYGGGVYVADGQGVLPVTFTDSTVSGNTAAGGLAIALYGGSAYGGSGYGGGLGLSASEGTVEVRSGTIALNTVRGGAASAPAATRVGGDALGGGAWVVVGAEGGAFRLAGTIVAANTAAAGTSGYGGPVQPVQGTASGPDLSGSALLYGYNLIGNADGAQVSGGLFVNQVGNGDAVIDPRLAPLGNYGGLTPTHALLVGSPALDAGDPFDGSEDQRRVAPVGTRDVGAFESRGFTLTATGGTPQSAVINTAFAAPLVATVTANDPGVPATGAVVTFYVRGTEGESALLDQNNPVTVGPDGVAAITARADGVAASYTVEATAPGVAGTATFALTNVPAPQTVSFDLPASVTYGVGPIPLSGTGGGSGNPVVFSVVSGPGRVDGDTLVITGAGTVVVRGTQAGNADFQEGVAERSVAVDRAALTVTADSRTRVAGQRNPPLTFSVSGLVNGDAAAAVLSGSLATDADGASPPGMYPITQGTLAAGANYALTFVPGTLTVTAAPAPPRPAVDQTAVAAFGINTGAGGPGAVTVYGPDGTALYTVVPFAPAESPNGVRVAVADVTGDGTPDVIAGTAPGVRGRVRVVDGVTRRPVAEYLAFEDTFVGGVFVAAADFNADRRADVAVSADVSGGPRVTVFSGATGGVMADFFGIDDLGFRGGARVGTGDLNNDGAADLIVAAGRLGGPRVAVFDGARLPFAGGANPTPPRLFADLFVFEAALRDGAYVTAGDLDGDGFADLIAGSGPGGGPRVRAWSGADLVAGHGGASAQLLNFLSGGPGGRDGARVVAKDLDGDGRADLLAAAAGDDGQAVTAFRGSALVRDGIPPSAFELMGFTSADEPGGVFVG